MRAVVYTRYGPPDVLRVEEVGVPSPAADELLLRVRAAEVTKSDCELRSFRFPVKWFWLPLRLALGVTRPRKPVLGGYFAGVVEAVGAEVTAFAPGDELFGCTGLSLGAHGELMCLPASSTLARKPRNLSFAEAASVPLGGLNALHFMRRADIQAGEKVLIVGAGGSIGIHAVQIARAMGAEVTAVDAPHKEEMLRGIGVERFIDYTQEDFADVGEQWDVVFSMVAAAPYAKCMRALSPKGRFLTANPRLSVMLRCALTNRFTARRAIFAFAGEKPEELAALKEMLEDGRLAAVVDRVYPLEEAAEAHQRVETEARVGAVILTP